MRIGELFSGYGGLGMGVQAVLGGDIAWHSDIDPGACKILAHRFGDVPNLGDITTVDWAAVEPVDVLTGGSPCQDLSHAGKRGGMTEGTRSNLWVSMREAIAQLLPPLVVWENVRGAYSAAADSDVEPCPGCVGDEPGVSLRALARVLGDLADLGYDAGWHGLRAADVGAPHGRFRVFVVAANADGGRGSRGFQPDDRDSSSRRGTSALPDERHPRDDTNADASGDGRHEGWPEPARLVGRPDAAVGGTPAADARSKRHGPGQDGAGVGRLDRHDEGQARQRQRARAVAGDRGAATAADTEGERWAGPDESRPVVVNDRPELAYGSEAERVQWGQYAAAIHRWERTLGRPGPAPTEPGRTGNPRLSPRFVEWLMGLPDGWVCDVPGLSRNDQLKALGNGVVTQQAAAAIRHLLTVTAVAA